MLVGDGRLGGISATIAALEVQMLSSWHPNWNLILDKSNGSDDIRIRRERHQRIHDTMSSRAPPQVSSRRCIGGTETPNPE